MAAATVEKASADPKKYNRAGFVKEYLAKKPDADYKEIAKAWVASGRPAELAPKGYHVANVKQERKKKASGGKETPRARLRPGETPKKKQELPNLVWLQEIEEALDDLIYSARKKGDLETMEWVRTARRRVTLKIAMHEHGS